MRILADSRRSSQEGLPESFYAQPRQKKAEGSRQAQSGKLRSLQGSSGGEKGSDVFALGRAGERMAESMLAGGSSFQRRGGSSSLFGSKAYDGPGEILPGLHIAPFAALLPLHSDLLAVRPGSFGKARLLERDRLGHLAHTALQSLQPRRLRPGTLN